MLLTGRSLWITLGIRETEDSVMAQLREQPPRWHMWAALVSGIFTGYALLIGVVLGFG